MPRNYYCLVAGLPNITIDDSKLSYSSQEFFEDIKDFVHKDDLEYFNNFLYTIDNENLYRAMIKHTHEFIPGGFYTQDQIEEAIEDPSNMIGYMKEYINEYHDEQFDKEVDRKRLTQLYYDHLMTEKNDFVRAWFELDLNIKNIFAALNCRKYDLNIEEELIDNNHVSEAILKSNARDFGLSGDIEYMDKLISIYDIEDLQKREKALDQFKWEWLDESTFFNYFSIEKLISFYVKLKMIERWIKLDPETGKEFFEKLINDLESSYEMPEEFKAKNKRKNN